MTTGNAMNRHAIVAQDRVTLNDIKYDCLVHILSFLPLDELNGAIIFVDKRLCRVRNLTPLDQTRTATIVCTGGHM